jgi:hypothetical protein
MYKSRKIEDRYGSEYYIYIRPFMAYARFNFQSLVRLGAQVYGTIGIFGLA